MKLTTQYEDSIGTAAAGISDDTNFEQFKQSNRY